MQLRQHTLPTGKVIFNVSPFPDLSQRKYVQSRQKSASTPKPVQSPRVVPT